MLNRSRFRLRTLSFSIATAGVIAVLLVRIFYLESMAEAVCVYFFVQGSRYSVPVAGESAVPALTRHELEIIQRSVGKDKLSLVAVGRPVNGNIGNCRKIAVVISSPTIQSIVKLPKSEFVVVHDSVVSYPLPSTDSSAIATLEIRSRDSQSGHQTTYLYYPNESPGVGGNAVDWEWVAE
jgi:hypothetical protein